jgi:hypothetical protein
MQLLNDLSQLMMPQEAKLAKPWLKNSEVRKLLGVSSNTIQRLRIGYEDIEKLMNSNEAKMEAVWTK